MRSKYLPLGAAGAGLLLALVGCSPAPEAEDIDRTLTIGIVAGADSLSFDPAKVGTTLGPEQAVYDQLIHFGVDSGYGDVGLEPGLATAWEYNDDGTILDLTLREGVEFSDGEPFNSEAAKANLDRLRTAPAVAVSYLTSIAEVTVTDDYSLELHLSTADPKLLYTLSTLLISSPAAFDDPDLGQNPVGSGPYLLDEDATTADVTYTVVRNENYWNTDAYYYDTIVFEVLPDITARINALKSGQIDATYIDSSTSADVTASGFTVTPYYSQWVGLAISDRAGELVPALGDVRVRQALNYAFDREAIATALGGGIGEPSNQPFVAGQPEFQEGEEDTYAYDPEKAKELLAEAGYPDGFEVKIPTFDAKTAAYEAIVQQALADIGITVIYEDKPTFDEGYAAYTDGSYPILITSDVFVNTLTNYVNPNGLFNGRHSTDPALEELFAASTDGTSTSEERAEASAAIGEFLLDEAWFAIFLHPANAFATTSDIEVTVQQVNGAIPQLQNFHPAS